MKILVGAAFAIAGIFSHYAIAGVDQTCAAGGCVNVTSSALPSGAATAGKQDSGNSLIAAAASSVASIDTKDDVARSTRASESTASAVSATASLIKAKTDNLDVLLSTRTKPADNQNITIGDSSSADASGRFRESQPFSVLDDFRQYDKSGVVWTDASSGVGATSTLNANEATVTLSVGAVAGSYEYRQTRYLPHVPHKSENITMTFVLETPDDLSLCVRTSTSGTPVDTCVGQTNWNIDCFCDPATHVGAINPSGLRIDTTKAQLFSIDFIWQGVGRIRYGFLLNGKLVYAHQITNYNSLTVPFMATPSLPARYEIRNSDGTHILKRLGYFDGDDGLFLQQTVNATSGSFKQICVSIESEGGYNVPGVAFAADNWLTPVAVTTRAPILAIRLAPTYKGKTNKKTAKLLHVGVIAKTNDAACETIHVHNPTATTGGTWVAADVDSAVEVNTGITSVTATMQHKVDSNYIPAGIGATVGTVIQPLDWLNNHTIISRNADSSASQMFVEYCTAITGTSNVAAEFNFDEVK